MTTNNNNKNNSRSKFKQQYVDQAYAACAEMGATMAQLAKLFNVSFMSIHRWMKGHEEFKDAIEKGRDRFDTQKIEKSLLRRARGYNYVEVTWKRNKNGQLVKAQKVNKHIPAEVSAIRYWLNNRQPQRWRNVKHVELFNEEDNKFKVNVVNYAGN